MLRRFLIAAGAALTAFAGAASAQDTPAPAPAPAPVSTGFRVEGLIGYDDAGFDSVIRGDGMLYGVGAGYDFALGGIRLGVEAEASESTARTCVPLTGLSGDVCLRAGRDLYLGARFGAMVSRGVLLYGKAGYTNFRENASFPPSVGSIETHANANGLRFGLGAEFAIGRRTFVKTEYRFSNYENASGFERQQAVIGFGFRF